MKFILTSVLLLFLISFRSFGQPCNCTQEFNYVKDKIEKNYAGFKDKVNSKTEATYRKRTQAALELSQSITTTPHCIYFINEWLTFFRDGHIQIGRNRISKEREEAELQERIQAIEYISLSNEELTNLKNTKGITGIYWNEDSTSRIAVIRNINRFREYAGVVISSKTGKWFPGQVVLELKSDKDTLKGIMYDRYYIPTMCHYELREML